MEEEMTASDAGALAVELQPRSTAHWIATYYPMRQTPAGRWADVTWTLHQRLLPSGEQPSGTTRWLEVRSPDPGHHCYAGHRGWAGQLAAGYTAARAVYDTEVTPQPHLSTAQARQSVAGAIVIPAEQLCEWQLDDLQDDTSEAHG
jgi:hypothetical protein